MRLDISRQALEAGLLSWTGNLVLTTPFNRYDCIEVIYLVPEYRNELLNRYSDDPPARMSFPRNYILLHATELLYA
jgi:hypothetical protein